MHVKVRLQMQVQLQVQVQVQVQLQMQMQVQGKMKVKASKVIGIRYQELLGMLQKDGNLGKSRLQISFFLYCC